MTASDDIHVGAGAPGIHLGSRVGGHMLALKGLFMEKWMCWGSMGVAGLLLVLFLVDLILGVPFAGPNYVVDVASILACGIVFYLAFDALRDLR